LVIHGKQKNVDLTFSMGKDVCLPFAKRSLADASEIPVENQKYLK
jgi:hypothetical protein